MPLTLHAAFVPSALQMLGTANHLIEKAEKWCAETGCDHSDVVGARIFEDMLPFAYQIKSVADHTAGAIAGIRAGVYSPPLGALPETFAEMREKISDAVSYLEAVSVEELEGMIGGDMRFEFRGTTLPFTAEDFLLSFSQPNFYFHAATAYDILRMKGVAVGKRDFTGRVRLKTA